MAVAVVEKLNKSQCMDCPPRQKKVVVVEEVKGFATSLSLKVRIFGTRPVWPIFYLLIAY